MTANITDRLREEWEALGHMSYHGTSSDGPWLADLTQTDIAAIRSLLKDAAESIAELHQREAAA